MDWHLIAGVWGGIGWSLAWWVGGKVKGSVPYIGKQRETQGRALSHSDPNPVLLLNHDCPWSDLWPIMSLATLLEDCCTVNHFISWTAEIKGMLEVSRWFVIRSYWSKHPESGCYLTVSKMILLSQNAEENTITQSHFYVLRLNCSALCVTQNNILGWVGLSALPGKLRNF